MRPEVPVLRDQPERPGIRQPGAEVFERRGVDPERNAIAETAKSSDTR